MRRNFRSWAVALLAAVAVLTLSGCWHPQNDVPEEHPGVWTPSEVENLLGGEDPLERFNRPMFACTDFLMNFVADPLGRIYTTILPRPVIEHFNNVCVNLEYPARLFSSLFQAEWKIAGTETVRFLANSTLGIAGIFDVSMAWWQIPPAEADFGQTFACWGFGPGETLMLPIAPTVNGRDFIGLIFDTAFDLKTYIPYAGYATFLNRMVIAQRKYDQAVSGALDPYKNYRQLMLVRRELQLQFYFYHEAQRQIAEFKRKAAEEEAAKKARAETKPEAQAPSSVRAESKQEAQLPPPPPPPAERILAPSWSHSRFLPLARFESQNPVTDSMRSIMFQAQKSDDFWYMPLSFFNSDFVRAARTRRVELDPDRPDLVYAFWPAPDVPDDVPQEPEKLVVILPGIGGSCTTGMLTAMAENFHHAGYSVLGLDSTFHWRFARADGKGLPGFLPDDAERVRKALIAVLADLRRREWIAMPEIVLCGYSMGGLQTLKIAELEAHDPQLGIKRFVAIQPPVSTGYALKRIDELVASSANWTKTELLKRLTSTAGSLMLKMTENYPLFDPARKDQLADRYQVPMDRDSARYVVGLSLKLSLRELLLAIHRDTPLPGLPEYSWWRRNDLYLAIDKLELADYAEKLLKPRYPDRNMDEMLAQSDLHSLETTLKNADNVRVLHSLDDFLLSPEDRQWLDSVLGKRLTWLSNGGHLGGLYYRTAAERILAAAEE